MWCNTGSRRDRLRLVHILVTGGAGYLGAVLIPKLLEASHVVTCYDCLLFGKKPISGVLGHPSFSLIVGDLRDRRRVEQALGSDEVDVVIHLAAISNDPSSDLDPALTRAVNLDAVDHLMNRAKAAGVSRFIYASSASVYGIKDTPDVTEDLPLEPITLYAKYKVEGEEILNSLVDSSFTGVSVRAATVCGYSPRLRLDLTINILTSHALTRGAIRVFGGSQKRPNIHIEDLTDLYVQLVESDPEAINGQAFNISQSNATVMELAEMIRAGIDPALPIEVVPTDDLRSYHLSAERIATVLGYTPKRPLVRAVENLKEAFSDGLIPDVDDKIYRNVAHMKEHLEFFTFDAKNPAS